MEKNHIKEQLELTEKLLDEVNSKEEYDYLIEERDRLRSRLHTLQNQERENQVIEELMEDFGEEKTAEILDYINSYSYPISAELSGVSQKQR